MPRSFLHPDGRKIREIRKSKGLTQAECVADLGFTKRTLERIEAGKPVTERVLSSLASSLGVPTRELIRMPREDKKSRASQIIGGSGERIYATKKLIGDVLQTRQPQIVVPEYQRSYCWTTSEVETLWEDLMHFESQCPKDKIGTGEYFLGSIVLLEAYGSLVLLDGQQRLATCMIFLSVAAEYLSKEDVSLAGAVIDRYVVGRSLETGEDYFCKLRLNGDDRVFFQAEVSLSLDCPHVTQMEPKLRSHQLIRAASDFFHEAFAGKYEEIGPKAFYRWIRRMITILLERVSIVEVISQDHENASRIFETLNDRGIGLSTPDLLRTFLILRTPEANKETVVGLWKRILELGDDNILKSFLRDYWAAYFEDIKTRGLFNEIRTQIEEENIGSVQLSQDLKHKADIYGEILEAQNEEDVETAILLQDINDLGAQKLYPCILKMCQWQDTAFFKAFLKSLISAYVRCVVMGWPDTKLSGFALGVVQRFSRELTLQDAMVMLRDFAPKDTDFQHMFEQATIVRRKTQRYLLRKLEEYMRRTTEFDLASTKRVHVEHIYPQNPPKSLKWANHDHMINRLGNLTLVAKELNLPARNAAFETKKEYYKTSHLKLCKELLHYQVWDADAVCRRQKKMAKQAVEIWSIPPGP